MNLEELFKSQPEQDKAQQPDHSLIKSLELDLKFYNDAIKEVALDILENALSEYPIFIAHQHQTSLGELILDKDEFGTSWSIHATTLEDLVEHQVVHPAKRNYFAQHFKDPRKYMCLFVVVPEGANFVFSPYVI